MQFRWIAISVVCFSAALLSACGGAPSTALASKADASAMSKSDGRYDTSSKKDKDECDESEDHDKSNDKSNDKSRSLSTKSSNKDKDHDKDHDKNHDDDDANCKVTVCHVPPGNACREHELHVGKSAV